MNCIIIEDDKLSRILIEKYINKTENLNLAYSFPNAFEALKKLKKEPINIDLIFLDIEMPGMNGFEFLNLLKNYPQVIIISAQEKYALISFDYEITDYLLKPITFERFTKAIDKAILKQENLNNLKTDKDNDDTNFFYIRTNQSAIRLKYDNIIYAEALENYVNICTFDSKYTVLHTLKSLEEKLALKNFKRIHRSYIVNMSKIQKIQNNKILVHTIEGLQFIPISKTYKKDILEQLPFIKQN